MHIRKKKKTVSWTGGLTSGPVFADMSSCTHSFFRWHGYTRPMTKYEMSEPKRKTKPPVQFVLSPTELFSLLTFANVLQNFEHVHPSIIKNHTLGRSALMISGAFPPLTVVMVYSSPLLILDLLRINLLTSILVSFLRNEHLSDKQLIGRIPATRMHL